MALISDPSIITSRPEKAFTTSGFCDWKHATGSKGIRLSHNNCISHKQAVVEWELFRATSKTGSVAEQLVSNRAEQIKKLRYYYFVADKKFLSRDLMNPVSLWIKVTLRRFNLLWLNMTQL